MAKKKIKPVKKKVKSSTKKSCARKCSREKVCGEPTPVIPSTDINTIPSKSMWKRLKELMGLD
jgi:hypothetical protein